MPPAQAVRQWVGSPPHPEGGGIPAHATEYRAADLAELYLLVNPGGPPAPPGPPIQDGMFADGTPADRSLGWGPLVSTPSPTYARRTDAPVIFLPVQLDSTVIGYLWAATTGDAAGYLPRAATGKVGVFAGGWWLERLENAYAQGISAVDALRRGRNFAPHPKSGAISADASEQQLAGLDELTALAAR
ncbi:hypothetical protein [Nocardia sp. alder85J]|uniref:hypothetical protein n=1 Tax=Nocardia sp. alder85J TaxID=2862949 RepID=UPI001CD1AD64|nr:hypothetical protein [Nocardia sp. alder85J]MCX4093047.1 hypothetical protein [Nocardia sp. alder85J]